jgi:DNA polymerase V
VYSVYYPEYKPYRLDGGITEIVVPFSTSTDDTIEMLKAIKPSLPRLFKDGRRYKKSGVVFWGLENGALQLDMFAPKINATNSKLFETVDKLNARYGRRALVSLSEGLDKKWLAKRNMASPNYTTDWNDIPIVH